MMTCVGTQDATLTDPDPLRPTVKAFARSPPLKLMLDVPGQAPPGQMAAKPLPSDCVTVRFPTIATAFEGTPAAAPATCTTRGLPVSPLPARSLPPGAERLS